MGKTLTYLTRALSSINFFRAPPQHPLFDDDPNSLSIPGMIPGGSNLKYCNVSSKSDIFQIDLLTVSPTPPLFGEYININLSGKLLKDIGPNATWHWDVNVDHSDFHGRDILPFCDAMEHIEQPDRNHSPSCPHNKGDALMYIHTWIPDEPWVISPGYFMVHFDAFTKDGERIYCLEGKFDLQRPQHENAIDGTTEGVEIKEEIGFDHVSTTAPGTHIKPIEVIETESSTKLSGPVPGDTNFTYCDVSKSTDLFQFDLLSVQPNPPKLYDYANINAYGTFLHTIPPNSTWTYTLISPSPDSTNPSPAATKTGTYNLCDPNLGMHFMQPDRSHVPSCPPEKGGGVMMLGGSVPWGLRPGHYTVRADAVTEDGKRIYCVESEWELKRPQWGEL